jgi:hypothetical protein
MSTAAKKESIYKQCAAAIDSLILNPPKDHDGVFTEIDVISEAASKDWSKADYDKAMHQANESCGKRYRDRKLCRYGPVKVGKGVNAARDYARIAGRIVYADAIDGPNEWKTPNGTFKKLMENEDTISRQGRKPAANRNDAESWDRQVIPSKLRRRRTVKSAKDRDVMEIVMQLVRRVDDLEQAEQQRNEFIKKQAERIST